jgi:hypothetical protein
MGVPMTRPCFNCGEDMVDGAILKCYVCDVTECREMPQGYHSPVIFTKYAVTRNESIPFIDHSREHIPSPG